MTSVTERRIRIEDVLPKSLREFAESPTVRDMFLGLWREPLLERGLISEERFSEAFVTGEWWEKVISVVSHYCHLAQERPVKIGRFWLWIVGEWHCGSWVWLYKDWYYLVDINQESYTDEQVSLLIQESVDKERRRFEKLKRKFAPGSQESSAARPRIPEAVRIQV